MQKIFQEYGGVIVTAMAIIALIGVIGLLFNPTGTGWMDGAFKGVINGFTDKVENAIPGEGSGDNTAAHLALPAKTYAFAGQPIKLYFLNIIGGNTLDSAVVQVDAGGRGTVYADRWEYTPTKAETIKLRISILDLEGQLLGKGVCTIEVRDASEKESLSVLVIGDSTISGGNETQALLNLAAADNYNLTLLGAQGNANNRHEGRAGWTAERYARYETSVDGAILNPFYNPSTGTFDFAYYMSSQGYEGVDCVCIQLGINDVFGANSDENLAQRMDAYFEHMEFIIESIRAYDTNIKIVWNMILPGSTDQSKFEAAYNSYQTAERYKRNTYLTNLEILGKTANMENVYIAPTNASLDVTNNMGSGGNGAVHPGAEGYREIGALLYSLLRAIN